jgi:hypothetical protein
MQYVAWTVYGLAVLFTLTWVVGIRSHTLRDTPPTMQTVNTTMLFVVCLILIPPLSISPFHVLWIYRQRTRIVRALQSACAMRWPINF